MSFRSMSLGAIAVCLAVGVPFASASVECDAERGICRKSGAPVPAAAPAMVEEEVAPAAGGHQPPDRESIHGLLAQHEKIQRSVKDIDGGIVSETTSQDPQVAAMIRKHTAEMKTRLEQGQPTRMWDPLFAALHEHHAEIAMSIVEIDGGVRVTETSKNPEVVALIRQHAHKGVSEFAAQGFERAHKASPLPETAGTAKPGAAARGTDERP